MKRIIITFMALTAIASAAVARQPRVGYRGFIEWSNSLRSQENWYDNGSTTEFYTGFSTSHGYQFTPLLFVGGGLDYEHYSDLDSNILALFVQGRTDLKLGKYTPFGDLRLGYNFVAGGGVYFSPTVGYRFNWGRKMGINIGAGLTLLGYSNDIYDVSFDNDGYMMLNKTGTVHDSVLFFSFRVGIDF